MREVDAHVVEIATTTGKQKAALTVYDDTGNAVAIGKDTTIGKGTIKVGAECLARQLEEGPDEQGPVSRRAQPVLVGVRRTRRDTVGWTTSPRPSLALPG